MSERDGSGWRLTARDRHQLARMRRIAGIRDRVAKTVSHQGRQQPDLIAWEAKDGTAASSIGASIHGSRGVPARRCAQCFHAAGIEGVVRWIGFGQRGDGKIRHRVKRAACPTASRCQFQRGVGRAACAFSWRRIRGRRRFFASSVAGRERNAMVSGHGTGWNWSRRINQRLPKGLSRFSVPLQLKPRERAHGLMTHGLMTHGLMAHGLMIFRSSTRSSSHTVATTAISAEPPASTSLR